MKDPYLVLRLEKPYNPIEFPCPESASGFYLQPKSTQPDAARSQWINTAIHCEYMGASEFEFGEIAKSLRNLASLGKAGDIAEQKLSLEGTPVIEASAATAPEALKLARQRTTTTWLLCPRQSREAVIAVIKKMSKSDKGPFRMKELHYMQEGLFGKVTQDPTTEIVKRIDSRRIGWFDLDNLWFLTRDKNQFQALKELLGLPI